jgi:cytosine/adenosine deaminase-related metal-dependent hydrolase
MPNFRARWVLPIDRPPIRDGWVGVADHRITAVSGGRPPADTEDLGDVALLPGLVNAHTHLELSWMAGRLPPASSMDEWMQGMLALRRAGPPGGDVEAMSAAARAAVAMHAAGTVLVGDISNTLISPPALSEAGIGGVVFHEIFGFNTADPVAHVREAWERVEQTRHRLRRESPDDAIRAASPAGIDFGVVAHAPYSVSPELLAEIARRGASEPLSIHLAESPEEIEFLRTGGGPIRRTLERLGVWTGSWRVPATDPVSYVAAHGYLRAGTLVVHGVHLTDDGVERLAKAGAVLVTCPRSNEWVGAGLPRLAHFYAAGLPVAIGTDSLASAPSLSVFDELAEARRIAPDVAAAALLESATRIGARALGRGRELGTLRAGKRAAMIAVAVPAGATDVEEYLVSGVPPEDVRPLAR